MKEGTAIELQPIEMTGIQTRLNQEEEEALLRVLRQAPSLSSGSEGRAFETEWTQYVGCADSVAVSNCTAALELAAVLSGLGAGDEVIVPAHTFVSSAVPFARTGATLRWADIDTHLISAPSIVVAPERENPRPGGGSPLRATGRHGSHP